MLTRIFHRIKAEDVHTITGRPDLEMTTTVPLAVIVVIEILHIEMQMVHLAIGIRTHRVHERIGIWMRRDRTEETTRIAIVTGDVTTLLLLLKLVEPVVEVLTGSDESERRGCNTENEKCTAGSSDFY